MSHAPHGIDPHGIDPRGPRFVAAVTAAILAGVLLTSSWLLLALQAVFFAVGVFAGVGSTPPGQFFRRVIRPRLAPPATLEDPRPLRFAQSVGLGFAGVGLLGFALGWTPLALAATALAFAAALLNAATGFCLGCEMYLLGRRLTSRTSAATPVGSH